ncbi:MAG: hypothetical protein V4735_06920 [Pseudomonadota bacterium]
MSDVSKANIVRFAPSDGHGRYAVRPLVGDATQITDGKGQFIVWQDSFMISQRATIACLEKRGDGQEQRRITEIGGTWQAPSMLFDVRDVIEQTLARTQFSDGNELPMVHAAISNLSRAIPNPATKTAQKKPSSFLEEFAKVSPSVKPVSYLTFSVDGLKDASGTLDPNVTVMDAICASPVIQGLRNANPTHAPRGSKGK